VIFRLRRAHNLVATGEDNTPYGMSGAESISQKLEFDVLDAEESIEAFIKRVTEVTVHHGYCHCAELSRIPHHITAFMEYNTELNFDSNNGYHVALHQPAASFNGKTLVFCYTNHMSDASPSVRSPPVRSARGKEEATTV
jgi:hypothetical protein